MNLNLLIELKKEYTEILLELLTPIVYEGIESIYKDAKNNSSEDQILKIFQALLKKIIDWEEKIVMKEYNRIIYKTKKNSPWIVDLIRAVIKANITILTVNKIPENVYEDINILNFIHLVYIETGRRLWNNPFLFYHKYSSIEVKRNLRDSLQIIKEAIESAIRKILPMNLILNKYLGDNRNYGKEFNFDVNLNATQLKNIPLLLELESEKYTTSERSTVKKHSDHSVYSNKNYSDKSSKKSEQSNKINTPDINNKIISMINNKVPLTESNEIFQKKENVKSEKISNSSSTLKKIINQSVNKSADTKSLSIDSKVKHKIKKNFADSESLTYNKEDNNNNYQDIFSNSDMKSGIIEQETNLNTHDKNENKSRDKFFNNYLNF